ncbi:MAG: AsnC family transcriptional regulator [Fimbriimonadaceae bacterium]|nr:AsnC family transcriptional regulator [Fimbriimonadaceae bacterium]
MASEQSSVVDPRPYQPDELDQRLLNELQTGFPLVDQPFAAVGERLGLAHDEVLRRVTELKAGKVLRQISAIFDSRRLGYRSSLVAMRFDPDDLEAGAAVINQHPGVSHNYKRNHAFNLWFTIAVPPSKTLDGEVAALAAKARPQQTWLLPTIKLFKIGVNLDMTGRQAATATEADEDNIGRRSAQAWLKEVVTPTLSPPELTAVRLLQRDLPVTAEPFADLVAGSGLAAAELFAIATAMLANNQLRRYAAVLHHRAAGFRANAMGVWVVPPERIDLVGEQMAAFRAVSHCYHRPTYPDWPYSVFTMIHGRHSRDCEDVVEAIRDATGVTEYALLYSTKEYKKTRVRYFVDDDRFDVDSIAGRS